MTSNYQFLAMLHEQLQPRGYLEIGVRYGDSLRLAQCRAIGIDPTPGAGGVLAPSAQVFCMTSDEFFQRGDLFGLEVDLVYIDGMHLYEYALRDFINVARWANERTVVVFDDTHPYNSAIAVREPLPGDWTGDVWKAMDIIDHVPNLNVFRAQVDVSPTGAYVVWGFGDYVKEQAGTFLDPMVNAPMMMKEILVPVDILERHHTISPEEAIKRILEDRT